MAESQDQQEIVAGKLDLWNMFEAMPYAVAAFNRNLCLMAANQRFRKALTSMGVDADPVGQGLSLLFPCADSELETICRRLADSGKHELVEYLLHNCGSKPIKCHLIGVEHGLDDLRLLFMMPQFQVPDASSVVATDFHKLTENVVDILFTADDQGRLVYISPQVERYGYSPREVIYHNIFEYIHLEDRAIAKHRFFETAIEKRGKPYQFRMMLKDGSCEWMEVKARSHFDEKQRLKSIDGVMRSIGERVELETERTRASRLEALELMAGGIAHDFNNLLTSILGGISLARSLEERAGRASEILGKAENAVVRAGELTRQLLSFARGSKPARQITELGELIEESVSLNLLGSNVQSKIEIMPDLWKIYADRGQLVQVFSNLVINAKQAMPGGGSICVNAQNVKLGDNDVEPLEHGHYVMVTVRDTGEGISTENLNKVFDPYFTTKQDGNGLGLATVFSILRRHGGVATVESQQGLGSEFRVYLPAVEGQIEDTEQVAHQTSGIQGNILIMDDEEDVSSICARILERAGHRVTTCSEGESAVSLYREASENGDPFDMVILDLTVPGGMGAVNTIRKLREFDPEVRALVSSGYFNDPVMAEPENFGFSGVVPKPYNFERMKSTVAKILGA